MAATFAFSESNTVSETVIDAISNLNFGSSDAPNLNTTTYHIVRNYPSYEKYIRGKFTGSWTEISNMKFWKSAGTLVAGENIKASANVTFATPVNTNNADSDIPVVVGSALAIKSYEGNTTIVYGVSGVSGYTDYIRLQMRTTTSTPSGAVNQKTFTLRYDEI